jgi:hypothetical protein
MTGLFELRLTERNVPWARLTGSHENRLEQAISAVEETLVRHFRYADPLG